MGPRILLVMEEAGQVDRMEERVMLEMAEEAAVALKEQWLDCSHWKLEAGRAYNFPQESEEHRHLTLRRAHWVQRQ